ncbi:hypothetical protein [Streptomyces sp. HB132]|uniref:hypothetical protein n=1 Tax=Streptomyces sp. HB132 TaxID=767388 RepID=UPI0019612B81|nr:hypothetical protein [Streptomyces sp. HB132]MBM7442772.1 hypothetical protein [Streptomyces sp. HB132]
MEAGPVGRVTRATMFAVVSVVLAATGHVLMSGSPLPSWALAAAFLGVAVPSWWFAARERGTRLVVGLAVTTQGVLHTAFETAQGLVPPTAAAPARTALPVGDLCATESTEPWGEDAGTCGGAANGGGMVGMDHTAHLSHMTSPNGVDGTTGVHHVEHMGHMASIGHMSHDMAAMSSTGMLAAHLLAALVCGMWLARGERAAFQILRSVAGWLLAPLQVPLVAPAPSPQPRTRARRGLSDRLPRGLLCTHDLDPRGPPGGLAAL